ASVARVSDLRRGLRGRVRPALPHPRAAGGVAPRDHHGGARSTVLPLLAAFTEARGGDRMTALLEGRNLTFAYDDRTVLKDATLALEPGELVALVGPNGAGKSTMLHVLLRLPAPSAGT